MSDAPDPGPDRADLAGAGCPELPRIHAFADDELPAREAAHARRHLGRCAECRSELAFLLQLAAAVARGVAAIDDMERAATAAVLGFWALDPAGRPS